MTSPPSSRTGRAAVVLAALALVPASAPPFGAALSIPLAGLALPLALIAVATAPRAVSLAVTATAIALLSIATTVGWLVHHVPRAEEAARRGRAEALRIRAMSEAVEAGGIRIEVEDAIVDPTDEPDLRRLVVSLRVINDEEWVVTLPPRLVWLEDLEGCSHKARGEYIEVPPGEWRRWELEFQIRPMAVDLVLQLNTSHRGCLSRWAIEPREVEG